MSAETLPPDPDGSTKVEALTHDELLDRIEASGKAKNFIAALRKLPRTPKALQSLRTMLQNIEDELGEVAAEKQARLDQEDAARKLEERKATERMQILAEEQAAKAKNIVQKPTIADMHFPKRLSDSDTWDSGVHQLMP